MRERERELVGGREGRAEQRERSQRWRRRRRRRWQWERNVDVGGARTKSALVTAHASNSPRRRRVSWGRHGGGTLRLCDLVSVLTTRCTHCAPLSLILENVSVITHAVQCLTSQLTLRNNCAGFSRSFLPVVLNM